MAFEKYDLTVKPYGFKKVNDLIQEVDFVRDISIKRLKEFRND